MKNINVFISIILSSALFLTSCANGKSSSENDNNKINLTVAFPMKEEDWYFNKTRRNEAEYLITDFNSISENYVIEKKEYESYERFLTEIISGNCPDMVYVGEWLDMTPLYGKNMLSDIYDLLDENYEDIYENSVLKSLEIDGKLYQMPHDYIVQSAVAKENVWGNDTDNSINHVMEKSKSEGYASAFDFSVDSYDFISFVSEEFMDFNEGSCNFTDGQFENVLAIMKDFNDSYSNLSDEYINGTFDLMSEDKILLCSCAFGSYDQLDYLVSLCGDELKYVGYPSDTANFHIAYPIASFSVFDSSENKDGAKEFIDYYTSYNSFVYDSPDTNGNMLNGMFCLPINKKASDYICEYSMNFNFYNLEESFRLKMREETRNQIDTINAGYKFTGENIRDILEEEISLYLNDVHTAKETCDNIQSRLSVYFSEQYS